MLPVMAKWAAICVVGYLTLLGCDGLGEFSTGEGEIYRGDVFGATDSSCGGIDCSFIRRGFSSNAVLEMTFDPDLAASEPGTISIVNESCASPFTDVPLLPITPLAHDQLGLYEFPGGARVRNYIFVGRPSDGPLANRDAMVFVSLIRGGKIEVRIIAGAGIDVCDPNDCSELDAGDCDFFGVFELKRKSDQ